MRLQNLKQKKLGIFTFLILFVFTLFCENEINNSSNNLKVESENQTLKIKQIILTRKNKNNFLTDEAIKNRIPYHENETFVSNKTTILIRNLYDLGKPFSYFNQIQVMAEQLEDNFINLHVITYEKPELKEVIIKGNKKVQKSDIEKLFILEDIHAINQTDLNTLVLEVKKLYRDKDFHLVEINSTLQQEENKVVAIININENKKSLIKRVFFKGNYNINSKRLSEIIFTREDWVLGFLNKAGSYRPENLEIDKRIIESYYKSNGYFTAAVTDAIVEMNPITKHFCVTFVINEGDLYTVCDVKVEGNEIVSEDLILDGLPIKKGCIYSAKDIRDSIELLRTLWGQYGYAFADIEPIIIPDEQNKTVSVTFNVELGDKVFINRINILGNKKTKEFIIRRQLTLQEGELLTTTQMDQSKDRVENLGYFDPTNGANWKINRIDDKFVDLDLVVNEVKTGRITGNMGFGGSPTNIYSLSKSFRFGGTAYDTNLFGEGIQARINGEWSREEWSTSINIVNPWFLGRPIYTDFDFYVTKSELTEELRNVSGFNERIIGGAIGVGYRLPVSLWLNETAITFKLGYEDIQHNRRPLVLDPTANGANALQIILDRRFQNGSIISLTSRMIQDTRNHILHPSRGYQWTAMGKLGLNGGIGCLGFGKFETEASWYTPLIGENTLVLAMHGFFGMVTNLENKVIPYRELYHIGGPASVRGYLFGQIGPTILGDSIGAKKALFWNIEIIFPIQKDFSIKGAVFYDGGAGWDTPDLNKIPSKDLSFLKNNRFEYRHSIGIGVRVLRPTSIKIDWGFKLNRKKGESKHELHFGAYRDF